jgi:cold shock CspA family protein
MFMLTGLKGVIHRWDEISGCGFVVEVGSKNAFFLHFTEVSSGEEHLKRGADVVFDTAPARTGGRFPKAINVIVTDPNANVGVQE